MLRFLILILSLSISVFALSDAKILKRADTLVQHKSKSDQFRSYNDYKNLYLRAIISENQTLRIRSLQGIVKSGRKLHIDVSQYADELLRIKPKKSSHKVQKLAYKPDIKKYKKIGIKSSHKLKSIGWIDGRLILKFDKRLVSKQINYFKLYDKNKKQYRYIFDIHASMLIKSQKLRKENIDKIKLAQYNTNTLRLVIANSQKVKISFKKDFDKLVINMRAMKKSSHTIKVPKSISPIRRDRNKIIVIDAGHGGKDPGAIGYKGYREKVIVLQISNELKKILKARGYKVYMSRPYDRFVKLSKRTEFANKKHADIFISVHANSVSKAQANKAYGIECYFLSPSRSERASRVAEKENRADMSDMNRYGKESFLGLLNHYKILASNKLAIDLQRGILGSLSKSYKNVKDGGVREGPFWVLVGAQMPAVLVEVGFVSNPREARRLVNRKYQKKLATGLADGIERYFANN